MKLWSDFIATSYPIKSAVAKAVAILFGVSFHTLTFSACKKLTVFKETLMNMYLHIAQDFMAVRFIPV